MNGELFEIMVIRLSHTPSDLSTENSIKLSLTLELIFLDHGLIIESIFLYLDHGLLFQWILISRISGRSGIQVYPANRETASHDQKQI